MTTTHVAIESNYLNEITSILTRALHGKACVLYLFGSRAAGTHNPVSDFDIGVSSSDDLRYELSAAREMLEESDIPFKVDVVELQSVSEEFKRKVMTQGVLLWKN